MDSLTKHELNRISQLEEDISSYKRIIKTLKEVKEDFKKELDQYKTAHDKLTAGLKEAVAESIKYKRERDELIKDVEQQRKLLKDFSRFIHRKVEVCPGKKEYMDFRDRLNELGIEERD